jgi:endonuclease YncB( thermonuclease family)
VAKYDRIIGVDTPEKSTEAGRAVKAIVEKWCDDNKPLMAKYFKEDKFGGRFDGELISGKTGETLSSYLILSGVARPYVGDAKKAWAETELTDVKLKANTILSPAVPQ